MGSIFLPICALGTIHPVYSGGVNYKYVVSKLNTREEEVPSSVGDTHTIEIKMLPTMMMVLLC